MSFREEAETEYNRIRKLGKWSKKTDEELRLIAQQNIVIKSIDVINRFSDRHEKTYVAELIRKYLSEYDIETVSERNTLGEIVYLEATNRRLQKQVEDARDLDGSTISLHLIEAIQDNSGHIAKLKETLGLNKSKKGEESQFDVLELLKKRGTKWRENNQASRNRVCPHCGKMILWRIRPEAWEQQKHPYFKDKILGNVTLVKLFQEGKITKKEVSDILETSEDYVDWLIKKWSLNNEESTRSISE